MRIHKEGHIFLLSLIIISVGLGALSHFFLPVAYDFIVGVSAIIFIFFLQFFRNPIRKITKGDNLIVAPADGKVVVIEEVEEPEYFKDKRIQVSIFMSPINVHVNRAPTDVKVKYFKYWPGKYLVAWHPKSSTENERTTTVFESKTGVEYLVRQIAGAAARRIVWYVEDKTTFNQGEDFGFIKFGSRVDLFLPLGTKINVELNQKSWGGQTVIAELN